MKIKSTLLTSMLTCACAVSAQAADWSNTELQLQYGDLTNAFTEEDIKTTTFTFQHASGWKYGSNFFFFDHDTTTYGSEIYGELYSTFSGKSILGLEFGGPIRDVGVVLGFNMAPEVDELKYLPGVQIDWNVPGFNFFNTLITTYMDDGRSTSFGVEEDDSWMFDVAWQMPFSIGSASFSFEGHAEYIAGRDISIDGTTVGEQEAWILAQPQLRWDAGKTLFNTANTVHLGLEYQYWQNKLGTETDENQVRLLAVWQL